MTGYHGTVTPAAIESQLKLPTARTIPLSGGLTFVCDGKAIPLLPSVCSAATAIGTVSGAGAVSAVKNYNPTPQFAG